MAVTTGSILAGGSSSRMGRSKAIIELDGRTMLARVADALRAGGITMVEVIGGEPDWARSIDARWRPDRFPGEGPLGGIITALTGATTPVVIVACDLPLLTPEVVQSLRAATGAVAWAATDHDEPLCGRWDPSVLDALEAQFATGERAVHRAVAGVHVQRVPVADRASMSNVNTPLDLADGRARLLARPPGPGTRVAAMPEEISVDELAASLDSRCLIDVREESEYLLGRVDGAILMPLATVPDHLDRIRALAPVTIICAVGGRSMRAAMYLVEQGITAINVAGGTNGWIASGRDVVAGEPLP